MRITSTCQARGRASRSSHPRRARYYLALQKEERKMNPIFEHQQYLLKRQVFALTGKFRFYDPMGNLVMFSEQKMFRWKEDIRVYSDESKTQEVLMVKARSILDFSVA